MPIGYYPKLNPFENDLPGYGFLGFGVGTEPLAPPQPQGPLSPGVLALRPEAFLEPPKRQRPVVKPQEPEPSATAPLFGPGGFSVVSPGDLAAARKAKGARITEQQRLISDLFYNKTRFTSPRAKGEFIESKEGVPEAGLVDFNDIDPKYRKTIQESYDAVGMQGMVPHSIDPRKLEPGQLGILLNVLSDKGLAKLYKSTRPMKTE
jgi:hypothetical protein